MLFKSIVLIQYIYAYGFRGILLFMSVYVLKRSKISLPFYGYVYLRQNTSDIGVFNQVFIYKHYKFVIPGKVTTIFDLGANNGMSALYFSKQYPDAKIYAVEPDAENFATLLKNVEGKKQIIAINKAIWNKEGFVNLSTGESWAIKVDESGSRKIACTTLNKLMSDYSISEIDFLKIDIETGEEQLFGSDTSFLKSTKNLAIELHDWMSPGSSKNFFNSIVKYDFNYSIYKDMSIFYNLSPRSV